MHSLNRVKMSDVAARQNGWAHFHCPAAVQWWIQINYSKGLLLFQTLMLSVNADCWLSAVSAGSQEVKSPRAPPDSRDVAAHWKCVRVCPAERDKLGLMERNRVFLLHTCGRISLARLRASPYAAFPAWFCSTARFTRPMSRAACPPTRLPDDRRAGVIFQTRGGGSLSAFLKHHLWRWALWPKWLRWSEVAADCPLQDTRCQGQPAAQHKSSALFFWGDPSFCLTRSWEKPARGLDQAHLCRTCWKTHAHRHTGTQTEDSWRSKADEELCVWLMPLSEQSA